MDVVRGLFKKKGLSSSEANKNDSFRNRRSNSDGGAAEGGGEGAPRNTNTNNPPPLYEHRPPPRTRATVSIEDEREILAAAAKAAGIRINGRVPEVGDFFAEAAAAGEPAPTRTRRHRRWIRKRRENEKEAMRRYHREDREEGVVGGGGGEEDEGVGVARAYPRGEDERFEEETRRAMEESRRAWDAAAAAAAAAASGSNNSGSHSRTRDRNDENDEDEEKLMKIASEMSKAANGEKLNSIQRLVSDLDINSRLKAANVNKTASGAAALEASTGRSVGRKFAARFHLTRCLSEFDVLDENADGFYDFWRDENSSTSLLFGGEDAPLPDLGELLSLRKQGASNDTPNEEHAIAYVVDRKSDDILNSLDELARKIHAQDPSDVFARAFALAMLVSNRLGGACETETKAFSIRATAMRDETKLKKINASCVVHIGHLSIGAEKQRAILFKALSSYAEVPCRLLRGGVYCDGDEDCAKIFIVNSSSDNATNGASRQTSDDEAFFASLGNDVDVRQIDLLRNVGKMTSPGGGAGGKKPLSSVEKEFFSASTDSASANDINFDFFSASNGGGEAKKKTPPSSSNFNEQKPRSHEKDLFDDMVSTASTPSSSSASLFDLSEVKMKTSAVPAKTSLTPKEEAAEKKRILIRRQAERILEVQEAEEEKEHTREIELKFRHKFHKKWDKVVKNLSLGETLEVFGVEVKDKKSTNELRKAYRRALLKFHPDRLARGGVSVHDKVNGEEIFKIINGKMENS
ncbi:unnamed protein product [Bathycoccus prasinos]